MVSSMIETWSLWFVPNPLAWLPPPSDAPYAAPERPERRQKQGQFVAGEHAGELGTLRFKLFIPSCYAGQALPLLVMLHGCGQGADDFAEGTRMNALAEARGCFVVYPEQSANANGARCWNWYEQANQYRGGGEPALIAGLTRQILDKYALDHERVFVAGLSAGGAMAVILGATYPELYAAVGSHSGMAYGCATNAGAAMAVMRDGIAGAPERAARKIPIIVFHGDVDGTVHPDNGAGTVAQALQAHCSRASTAKEQGRCGGRNYTRMVHCDRRGNALAEHWIVHGTGHAWSGGSMRGSYTDSAGPDAAAEMMRFFLPE